MKTHSHHSNSQTLKSTNELKQIMDTVLSLAHQHGATEASVSVNLDRGFSVDVRMGEVETVAFSEDQGVGLNVYIGKAKGSASSSDTSPEALKQMVVAAIDIAKVSTPDPCFGLPDKALMEHRLPDLDLYHPWDLSPQQAIEMALACEHEALSFDKRISNSDGVHVATYQFSQGHANSHGFEGWLNSSRHSVSCSLIAQENDVMQRDYDYTTARCADDLTDVNTLAQSAAKRTVDRLGAKKIKTQKVPVLFSSRVSSGLFSSFIGAISGSNLYRKNTFLLNTLGQQIFPEYIRVYERPHLLRALGSAPFDGEGVATRPNVFVENGCIHQYVLGCYSARKLGLETTANSGGVFNLTIDSTAGDLDELLRKMDTGLLVTELMGQGVNILTGDYSRGASGFWVQGGKILHPVEEITIAGNLKEMFRNILAIGADRNPSISTFCGSVLIDTMTVAGH